VIEEGKDGVKKKNAEERREGREIGGKERKTETKLKNI